MDLGSIPSRATVAVSCWFGGLIVTQVDAGSILAGHPKCGFDSCWFADAGSDGSLVRFQMMVTLRLNNV